MMHKEFQKPEEIKNIRNQPSADELHLLVFNFIHENSTIFQLIEHLGDIGNARISYVKNHFEIELLKFVKAGIKNTMIELVSNGISEFIIHARNGLKLDSKFFYEWSERLKRNGISLNHESVVKEWENDLQKFYYFLESRFVTTGPEETMRNLIIEWFETGEMSLEIWKEWIRWFSNGINLKTLKQINWPNSSQKDTVKPKFIKVLCLIPTDEFLEVEILQRILKLYLDEPKMEVDMDEFVDKNGIKTSKKTKTLNVIGKTIFLSTIREGLEKKMQEENIEQVDIIARNTFHIDYDLTNDIWKSINISIVADKVNIWDQRIIHLSGKGYGDLNKCIKKAKNGINGKNGDNGKNGKAGESSGNITIVTEEMTNPGNLTLKLNGGDGENGESGGDGCNGKDGKGITLKEFNSILVNYTSLYRDFWTTFKTFSPKGWKKITDFYIDDCDLIFYEFEDDDGRKLHYSYGADKGWCYSWYELMLWVKGTNGTSGGIGGLNGKGGEGGNLGEHKIINSITEMEYGGINIIRHNGNDGKDGSVGECGKPGINGNDMAFIDRSATGDNKHYFGSKEDSRLILKYFSKNGEFRRINRYLKEIKEQSAYYGEFCCIEIPPGKLMQKLEKNENRSSETQTTMKQSIVLNKIKQKAQIHKTKMEGEINSAAAALAKAKIIQRLKADENAAEETETIEQEEEVVIVKEINEEQLEISKTNARKCKKSPQQFIGLLNRKLNYEGCCLLAQEVIDYFLIEFDNGIHERIKHRIMLKCSRFREMMKNPFKSIIVAAVQLKKSDGLTLSHLLSLAEIASMKRKTKKAVTRLRSKVDKFSSYCQIENLSIDEKITKNNDNKLEKVKFLDPVKHELWHPDAPKYEIDSIVDIFFKDYHLNEVESNILLIIFETFQALSEKFKTLFKPFKRSDIKWCHNDSWKVHKESLIKSNKDVIEIMKIISFDTQWLEKTFEAFSKRIHDNNKTDKILDTAKNLVIDNEFQIRFGRVPQFHTELDKNLKAAQYLIRFYWQMKKLLKFNKRLMLVNLYYNSEITNSNNEVSSYYTLQLPSLIKLIETNNKIILDANECQEFMKLKGFQSKAFRYLFSEITDSNIEIYGNEKYGTIEEFEIWKGKNLIQLYFDGHKFFNITPDLNFRKLNAARNNTIWDLEFKENQNRLIKYSWDYKTDEDKNNFASYFMPSFYATVIEWIDCYIASTNNESNLLKILHERFEIDGNHLSIADFQFLISTAIFLQTQCEVSSEFIVNLAFSVPQTKLVDTFFITRLESQWRTQLTCVKKISQILQSITNNRLKILLATKLQNDSYIKNEIDEEIIQKLLLMLRHTSTNNHQLEKMNIEEWKEASSRQMYFDVSDKIKNFGSIGFYIISLKQQGRLEANALEKLLIDETKEYHIPEKLIAQVCSLISHNEINFNSEYASKLDALLTKITEYSEYEKNGKHVLITNELDQVRMIQKVQNSESYKRVISEKERTIQDISELIIGVHDNAHQEEERKTASQSIAFLLSVKENETTKLLNKIDECIQMLTSGKINLRPTQKMTIMYAVESDDTHLLSQVNTGEGKSYIVASIAIIRALQKNKDGSHFKAVDIITSSSVLAQRDALEMQKLYESMNLNVDHNCHEDLEKRKQAYKANVVYGEIGRFQRDYLLHNFYRKNILGDRDRQHCCVIVDEVDNMLLDNGNNMLYLSHSVPGMDLLDSLFVYLQKIICIPTTKKDGDKEKAFITKTIYTEIMSDLLGRISKEEIELIANSPQAKGSCFAVWSCLINEQIIDSEGYLLIQCKNNFDNIKSKLSLSLESLTTKAHSDKIVTCLKIIINRRREINIPAYLIPFVRRHLIEYIENAKRALFMNPNEAYVVDVDHTRQDSDITPKVTIIDQNTGVDLATSQWSEGLHQCMQIKHSCRLNPISMKAVFVSNVNYLKGYSKINGLSGTLGSIEESKTLVELYGAELIKLPTFKVKRLYEHVPIISKEESEWLDSIFEEVEDQVKADRSVLIVCRSIAEVLQVNDGLIKRYKELVNPNKNLIKCYENLIVYRREFDEFEFNGNNSLRTGHLIIATNLAGRGTDIKLSPELKEAGGLHVIISFLPDNSRIEDQAYGRAARSGDPGSGQIIAITNQIDGTGNAPSVFDLKIFRDNAEVQRLKSMSDYYNFHTKIEEECLNAFKQYCLEALGNMNDSKKRENGIPTEEEIIYFALLDEWALWLDSQSAAIKQCAQDRSSHQKTQIIASVREFLKEHPIFPIYEALKWINFPQPTLSLGLIKINENKIEEAEIIFDRIIFTFPEFAGVACYYKGIITQRKVRKVKNIPKIGGENSRWIKRCANKVGMTINDFINPKLNKFGRGVPDKYCEIDENEKIRTEDYFAQAIGAFNYNIEKKEDLNTLVSYLQQAARFGCIKSDGFKNQTNDTKVVNDALITSAYDMIGHPVNYLTFVADEAKTIEKKFEAYEKFLYLSSEGYVSPKTINHSILASQFEILKNKYMISKTKVQRVFNNFINDGNCPEFYGRTVLQENEIKKAFKLPSREEFWGFLECYGCFETHEEFYILDVTSSSDGEIKEIKNLKPFKPPKAQSFSIQLSDYDLTSKKLYKASEIENAFKGNETKFRWLKSMKYLIRDASAIVNIKNYVQTAFMPNYDYFVIEDLAEWLEVEISEVEWIIEKLIQMKTIKVETVILSKLNNENINLDLDIPEKEIQKYKSFLNMSSQLQSLDDINLDVIKVIFNQRDEEEALNIYKDLIHHKIIIPYQKDFYFQDIDSLKCFYLPECLRDSIEMFLFNKFAYTFAYHSLFKSLQAASVEKNSEATKIPLMLAWKPHENFMEDLIKFGFIHDHKLETREKEFIDEEYQEKMKEIEKKIKSRLFIKPATLMGTRNYFNIENVEAGEDILIQTINSMKQVGKIGENYWHIFWTFLSIAVGIFKACTWIGLISLATKILSDFNSYYTQSLIVIAAIGTMLYFIQIEKAKYITQTPRESPRERYAKIINFHGNNIKINEKSMKETKLGSIIAISIKSKFSDDILELDELNFVVDPWKSITPSVVDMGPRKMARLAINFLNEPHNWKKFHDAIRDFLTRVKPQIVSSYFRLLQKNNKDNGDFNIENCINVFETDDDNQLKLKMNEAEKKLIKSLISKVIEDCIVGLQEINNKNGDDSMDEEEPPLIDPYSFNFFEEDSHDDEEKNNDLKEAQKLSKKFSNKLRKQIKQVYNEEVTTQITKPIINLFSKYVVEINSKTEESEKNFSKFLEDNSNEKLAMEEREKQVVAFQSMPFIVQDLHNMIRAIYENQPSKQLLRVAILHGHALFKESMKEIVDILFIIFERHDASLENINVAMNDNGFIQPFSSSANKEKLPGKIINISLTLHNGNFYICQNDSKKNIKNNTNAAYIGTCLFESITKYCPEESEVTKQGEEAFRNAILSYL